jgi:DNA-binding Xre family transcriptional regulator
MKHTFVVTPSGEELVLIAKADFDRIEEALDVAAYDRAKAEDTGETLTPEEVAKALEAPTPLAFWRAKRGVKQKDLAAQAGISQSYAADLEAGRRKGEPVLFKRLAVALRVRIEDLIANDSPHPPLRAKRSHPAS